MTTPKFKVGDRVIVPGTPYLADDQAAVDGGPGVVRAAGADFVDVWIDGQLRTRPYTYAHSELKREP